jgi:AcrR family transcriptional regulator
VTITGDAIVPATTRAVRMPKTARRAQLLEAARAVFVVQGFHAAAMDDIADRAGISKPVLYQHFPSKRELYLALLDNSIETLIVALGKALASTTDNKQRVAATVAAYFAFVDEEGSAFRLVFESDLINSSEVRERLERVTQLSADAIGEVIGEDTGLPVEQARLLAAGMIGMSQVAARYWLAANGTIPRDAAATLVASLSWRGISGWPLHDTDHQQPVASELG